jgi:hypothetical protein
MYCIRLLIDFLHVDMIHMFLLEWIWLVGIILLPFAVISIVPLIVALVAHYLANSFLHEVILFVAVIAIVASIAVLVVSLVDIMVVAISFVLLMSIPSM